MAITDAAAAAVAIAEMGGPMAITDAAAAAAAIAEMGGPGLSFDVKDAVKEERWHERPSDLSRSRPIMAAFVVLLAARCSAATRPCGRQAS